MACPIKSLELCINEAFLDLLRPTRPSSPLPGRMALGGMGTGPICLSKLTRKVPPAPTTTIHSKAQVASVLFTLVTLFRT